mmetsp:Transcript_2534/g.5513  ORF Transcript_2534/g.5513 Transcript_2534/m.5513 type:complete len:290 (+) Transcript_2534:1182-2051(+)
MFIANIAQPRLKLLGISNGCTQCEEGAVAASDDSLQGITFWSIKGVDLIKNKIIKLTVSPIKNHELSLTLLHLLTCGTSCLDEGLLNSTWGTDVHLCTTGDFLEGDEVSSNSDITTKELIVGRGNLPHESFTGEDKEHCAFRLLTGVGTEKSLARRRRRAHNSTPPLINRSKDITLPVFQLEVPVVTTQWWKTVRHICQLKGDDIFLSIHHLPRVLEGVLELVTIILQQILKSFGIRRKDDLFLLIRFVLALFVFLGVLFGVFLGLFVVALGLLLGGLLSGDFILARLE